MPPEPNTPQDSVVHLLAEARAGSADALGELFERYRPYLLLIANAELAQEVRTRVAPSDAVQETWMKVYRDFDQFQGETPDVWKAWLRVVLRNTLGNCERDHKAAIRDVRGEVRFQGGASGATPADRLPAQGSSPSSIILREERDRLLRDAVDRLPEHYREVVRLRSLEGVPFEEIARHRGKSEAAVRKLWGRAVEMLADLLENPGDTPLP